MLVLMEHPDHGRTHVYNNVEYEDHVKNGWRPVETEAKEQPKKPGRPRKVNDDRIQTN